MQTPTQIFTALQAAHGELGDYALLQNAYYSNVPGSNAYIANAVTINDIKNMQAEGYCDDNGYPDAAECGHLSWDIINPNCDDESDACDWSVWDYYDVSNTYVRSAE